VGEDARNGRLYIPRTWLREEGIDPDTWLSNPRFTPALGKVVARLLQNADELYERSQAGIATLPRDCRCAIMAARKVYAEIGREVERLGYDSVNQRAVVSGLRKKRLVLSSLRVAIFGGTKKQYPQMERSIAYLVNAVPVEDPYAHYGGSLEQRVVWVINLLEKTELRRIAQYESLSNKNPSYLNK
jgi:phytoene synthase